ncbi:TPA: hypothetical protein ACH3X2_000407 [Trebouxia sp. C0005]
MNAEQAWHQHSRAALQQSATLLLLGQQVDQKLSAALQQRYEMKQQALGRG